MCHWRGLARYYVGRVIWETLWRASLREEQDHGPAPWPRPNLRLWRLVHLLCVLHLPLLLHHAEPFCGRHHGQLRLPHEGLLHPRVPSSRGVHHCMGGLWSQWNVSQNLRAEHWRNLNICTTLKINLNRIVSVSGAPSTTLRHWSCSRILTLRWVLGKSARIRWLTNGLLGWTCQ